MSPSSRRAADSPRLSVIVPVYNDPDGIRTTLESLVAQTYPTACYEVVVVDNGSDDTTPDVVREYCERYPELVTLLVEDEIQSSYAARNRGIEHVRGSLVSFIDADMTVKPTWAESVVASAEANDWDYMGCDIETYIVGEGSLTATYDRALGFTVRRYLEEAHFTVTACLTVRRSVFDHVGGFDSRLISGGDGEFGERVHNAGLTQYFEPNITVYHPARTTLGAWLRKQFRVGRGSIQRRRYHPERAGSSHPLDPRKFLPLRPRTFYGRLTDATTPTARETIGLYGIGYLSKLARAAGGLYEQYLRG
ncbi:glycosyltransferase family 2 protein [Halococcus sp. IIIV-5B]|uniref:glycosyltransferase n=1 Tax=Halococcus sp. IIIV-5B TaxID=2321230 RepID=UPI000E7644C3|nr:glycosyltransferase [Halococcus sp. IIIV-5B]RJS97464.1 glycosyltransferase [Halococcus sp. IIIV-5B]